MLAVIVPIAALLWLVSFGRLARRAWRSANSADVTGGRPLVAYTVLLVLVALLALVWAVSLTDGYPSGSNGRRLMADRGTVVFMLAVPALTAGYVALAKESWRTIAAMVATALVTVALCLLATTQKPSCCTNWMPGKPSPSATSTVKVS